MAKDNGGPAFPVIEENCKGWGMTIRQYYKAAALQGMLANIAETKYSEHRDSYFVDRSAKLADAMIAEDKKAGEAQS